MNYSSKNEHCTTLPKSIYKPSKTEYFEPSDTLINSFKHTSFKNIDEYHSNTENHDNLPRFKVKHLFKRQCHKSWPDIYKVFDRPKLRRSLSCDMQVPDFSFDYPDSVTEQSELVSASKLLDVNYEQLLNDMGSNKQNLLNKNKLHNHGNFPKRIKRRSKFFTLPLKILEESDDDTRSNISDGSRTLIPYDEFQPSKYTGSSGLVSTYFPGQDLFKFLSSGQFVPANAELDRENAHFKISEAIIGTIEQVSNHLLSLCYFYLYI